MEKRRRPRIEENWATAEHCSNSWFDNETSIQNTYLEISRTRWFTGILDKKYEIYRGQKLAEFYNKCLQNDTVPTWMKTVQTTLAMKDKNKGADVSNYRWLRTCLPLSWKLLTWIISQAIHKHLEQQNLLSEKLKSYQKNSRETKNQSGFDLSFWSAVVKIYPFAALLLDE